MITIVVNNNCKNKRRSKRTVFGNNVIVGIRKVCRFGNNLYIAPPREWIEKHGLEAGDEVSFVADTILKIIPFEKT